MHLNQELGIDEKPQQPPQPPNQLTSSADISPVHASHHAGHEACASGVGPSRVSLSGVGPVGVGPGEEVAGGPPAEVLLLEPFHQPQNNGGHDIEAAGIEGCESNQFVVNLSNHAVINDSIGANQQNTISTMSCEPFSEQVIQYDTRL